MFFSNLSGLAYDWLDFGMRALKFQKYNKDKYVNF